MSEGLGRAELELATNQSKLDTGLQQAETKSLGFLGKVKNSFSRLSGSTMGGAVLQGVGLGAGLGAFNMISAGVGKVVDYFGSAIEAASDLGETVSKTSQIFGAEALPGLEKWAETAADSFGQSKRQALDAASNFAIFGKSAGLAGEDLTGFSTDLTELASDLASFHNTSPEDAITAIGAALRGESEPIRRYGVLLDEASLRQKAFEMGIIATTKNALTPQQRVLAAQALIMQQTADAQGDFARTSDGLANTQRSVNAQLEDASAEIGETLLPVWLDIVNLFKDVGIPVLKLLAEAIKLLIIPIELVVNAARALADAVGGAIDDMAMNFGDMGDALHDVADKAGVEFQAVKDYVKDAMAESGLSFEEAVDKARQHFGELPEIAGTAGQVADQVKGEWRGMKESVVADSADMATETKAHQRDMLESTRTTGDAIEDEYADTYRHTLQDTRDWATEMLAIFKEQEDPVRQAGATAADAYTAEIENMHKISALEAELASKDLREKLASQDPQIRADAEARRAGLVGELITLQNEYATQGDRTAQIARTKALLTGQFMADGLNAKDPEVRAAFIGWQTELQLRMGQLEGAAFSGGTAVTAEFARAVRLSQWTMARALQEATQLARNQFPGSEPKDPSSPFRGITRAFGFMDVLAGGVRSEQGVFTGALRDVMGRARGALDMGRLSAPAFALDGGISGSLASVQRLSGQGEMHIHYELTVDGLRKEIGSREEALDELRRMSVWER